MAYQGVRECVVCAWREGCRLRWRNEPNGALFCPEFSYDLRLQKPEGEDGQPPREGHRQGGQ